MHTVAAKWVESPRKKTEITLLLECIHNYSLNMYTWLEREYSKVSKELLVARNGSHYWLLGQPKEKITYFKKLSIWPWNFVRSVMIYASLKSRCSQLSFGVLIVQIGWEKEKLHAFQNYMYIGKKYTCTYP